MKDVEPFYLYFFQHRNPFEQNQALKVLQSQKSKKTLFGK